MLGHYKAVVWYTGDDYVTRIPGQPAGTGAAKLADDEMLAVRGYLNEGGKLLYTGKNAGQEYFDAFDYQPVSEPPFCNNADQGEDRCLQLSNDFVQYYLGGFIYADAAGLDTSGNPWPLKGVADPFSSLSFALAGADSANNQDEPASFVVTSSVLPKDDYPQFASDRAAVYDRTSGAPYEPFTGSEYMYSQQADQTYKRLTHGVDLTGKTAGALSFQISYDTEPDYDYVFVEAHTVGADDWTTLPAKLDDGTDATSTSTGFSCERGTPNGSDWQSLHPFLAHYQTVAADGDLHADGLERLVERRDGQLRRLAALDGRPLRVRRQERGAVDQLRIRPGGAGSRRLRRRRQDHGRRRDGLGDVVRGRRGRLDHARPARGHRRQGQHLEAQPEGVRRGPGHQDRGHPLLRVRLRGHRRRRDAGGRDEALALVPRRPRLGRHEHGARVAPRARPGRP